VEHRPRSPRWQDSARCSDRCSVDRALPARTTGGGAWRAGIARPTEQVAPIDRGTERRRLAAGLAAGHGAWIARYTEQGGAWWGRFLAAPHPRSDARPRLRRAAATALLPGRMGRIRGAARHGPILASPNGMTDGPDPEASSL
jgi:hypothetical protein